MSLLLLFSGAGTSTIPTTPTITPPAVGWVGRRRHDPKELEKRLKNQRENTFSRTRFNELLEAEKGLKFKAEQAAKGKKKQALERASNAASEALEEFKESTAKISEADIARLTAAIHAVTAAQNIRATAERSRIAVIAAHTAMRMLREAEERQDEEDVVMLLLS